jgi:hypothetical protein
VADMRDLLNDSILDDSFNDPDFSKKLD